MVLYCSVDVIQSRIATKRERPVAQTQPEGRMRTFDFPEFVVFRGPQTASANHARACFK
jgi:hypothetical protein